MQTVTSARVKDDSNVQCALFQYMPSEMEIIYN